MAINKYINRMLARAASTGYGRHSLSKLVIILVKKALDNNNE
jgi:hypothetical protein